MARNMVSLVVALLIVGLVGYVVLAATVDKAEMQEQIERSEAYCYQAFGDPEIYNAMVVGNHGGLHCIANDGEPHLHDVTEEARMAAYYANQSGAKVNWLTIDRYKPWYRRGNVATLVDFATLVPIVLLFGIIVLGLPYLPGRF